MGAQVQFQPYRVGTDLGGHRSPAAIWPRANPQEVKGGYAGASRRRSRDHERRDRCARAASKGDSGSMLGRTGAFRGALLREPLAVKSVISELL
jgi:hypothetical protein